MLQEIDDVLVKEDETKDLRDAIKFARTWMGTTGRIAVVYNDGKFYRVLVEEYDLIRDISLTAKIERLYKSSHPTIFFILFLTKT